MIKYILSDFCILYFLLCGSPWCFSFRLFEEFLFDKYFWILRDCVLHERRLHLNLIWRWNVLLLFPWWSTFDLLFLIFLLGLEKSFLPLLKKLFMKDLVLWFSLIGKHMVQTFIAPRLVVVFHSLFAPQTNFILCLSLYFQRTVFENLLWI